MLKDHPRFPTKTQNEWDDQMLLRAWLGAQKIAAKRNEDALKSQIEELTCALDRAKNEALVSKAQQQDTLNLLNTVSSLPVSAPPQDVSYLRAEFEHLKGRVGGREQELKLKIGGIRNLKLVGQLWSEDNAVLKPRCAVLAIAFFDETGQPLEGPAFLHSSELFGDYTYIMLDALGWFELPIAPPLSATMMVLSVHDFRAHIDAAARRPDLPPLILGGLDVLAIGGHLIKDLHMETTAGDKSCILLVGQPLREILSFNVAQKEIRFDLDLTTWDHLEAEAVVEVFAYGGENTPPFRQVLQLQGYARHPVTFRSSVAFTKLCVQVSALDPDRSVLLMPPPQRVASGLALMDVFKLLNQETVPLLHLEQMAQAWEATGRWFDISCDLQRLEGPVCLVQRVEPETAPLSLGVMLCGAGALGWNRRGLVLSVFYYDAAGQHINFKPAQFAYSTAVGTYQYIPVSNAAQSLQVFIPKPTASEGRPAYLAVCLQPWNGQSFSYVSSQPRLAPSAVLGRRFEDQNMMPSDTKPVHWHGVFVSFAQRQRQEVLLPNAWQATLERHPGAEVLIRLGPDADLTLWGDIAQTWSSPMLHHLRALVLTAKANGHPVALDLTRMADDAPLPHALLVIAGRLVLAPHQVGRLSHAAPNAKIIVTKDLGQETAL